MTGSTSLTKILLCLVLMFMNTYRKKEGEEGEGKGRILTSVLTWLLYSFLVFVEEVRVLTIPLKF